MADRHWQEGEIVQFIYKSGSYVGRIHEIRSSKAVVEVLAVLKHPKQGDLHHRNQAEVSIFHQRKALSFHEKALVPFPFIQSFSGEVPGYEHSLRDALQAELAYYREQGDDAYAQKALVQLSDLEKDYFQT